MKRIYLLTGILSLLTIGLSGCTTPAAPLLAAQMGAQQVGIAIEDRHARAAAALKEEPELLSFSVEAIKYDTTEDAAATYLKGYRLEDYSPNMRSLALYQVALLYMNSFNRQRDDAKAIEYFQEHRRAFPNSVLKGRISKHLQTIEARKNSGDDLDIKRRLSTMNRDELLKKPDIPFDADLTPMSERAISYGQVNDAQQVYTIVYQNTASSDEVRAKALYQMGLIFMNPFHQAHNDQTALNYFRQIKREFPNSSVAHEANRHISLILNRPD